MTLAQETWNQLGLYPDTYDNYKPNCTFVVSPRRKLTPRENMRKVPGFYVTMLIQQTSKFSYTTKNGLHETPQKPLRVIMGAFHDEQLAELAAATLTMLQTGT